MRSRDGTHLEYVHGEVEALAMGELVYGGGEPSTRQLARDVLRRVELPRLQQREEIDEVILMPRHSAPAGKLRLLLCRRGGRYARLSAI